MKTKQKIQLLLVEDHDSVSLGVVFSLQQNNQYQFEIKTVSTADNAYDLIKKNSFDIILLDLILKDYSPVCKLKSGEDLLRELNKNSSRPSVVVMSKIDRLEMLDYVINVLNADAYILKSRTSLTEIIPAINAVTQGENFYSNSIKNLLRFNENILEIDFTDRLILKSLSMGYKQSEIVGVLKGRDIFITVSAIEKRIKKLKIRFDAHNTNQLIAIAVKEGIL